MQKRIASIAVAAVVLAGCTDWEVYRREGAALIAAHGPKVAELLQALEVLGARAGALPQDLPGAPELVKKVALEKASLLAVKANQDGFAPALARLAKDGSPGQALQLLEGLKASLTRGVAAAGAAVGPLSDEVGRLETEAKKRTQGFSRALSTGFSLSGSLTGIESQLVAFIEDAGRPVDKGTWFDFDRLVFETGSAQLDQAQSRGQLVNVAEILKAYPKVKVKVGGYTDNVGNAAANLKLSAQRAKNVAASILGLGVKADRLDPEGYGAEHPVCPANDTEACRAQNRRISLRVTAK
jgi:outer membrane protein OmpA-like peptidoglycan-associated protein